MDCATTPSYSRPRLVVACRDGTVHLYAIGAGSLQHIYTVELTEVLPAAVAFSAGMQFVTVFSQNDGDVLVFFGVGMVRDDLHITIPDYLG